jgi:hypothetical protein
VVGGAYDAGELDDTLGKTEPVVYEGVGGSVLGCEDGGVEVVQFVWVGVCEEETGLCFGSSVGFAGFCGGL